MGGGTRRASGSAPLMNLLRPPWCRDAAEPHVHRILVVEDEAAIRDLLADFFRLEGYAVEASHNGVEALARARRDPACLVVLDLMMPVMDGPSFVLACREDVGLRELPNVVMTAARRETAVEHLPVQGFVPKPFDLHRLLATVVTILGENQAIRALPAAPPSQAEVPPAAP